jgi:RHS repeat-associated protein
VVTSNYDANGWLAGLSTQSGSTVTTLASNLAYAGLAGAAGKITTMDLGSGDIYNASYDTGIRLTSASLTQASTNTLLYQTQPAYDAANNVVSVATSISGATDTQQFCYDSLNRLTWAGSTGTPPCASLAPGTLTAAQYQQSYTYNVDGGLTSGPNGSYTYGNSSQPHAVTSTSNGYSAAYDAAGNMTCRALTNATTCSGTQTGQQLSYDAEGRLSSWQNQQSSPTSTANYLYDGAGNRVAMQTTQGGTTTLTAYIGTIEEVQTTGSTTQTTTYYSVGGQRIAANVNGTLYYFGYDALGSQVVVLNNSGSIVGSQLYGPYGSSRYSNGTLPTSIGFTGQQFDSVTGLDYYVARYYDPVVGVFLSADTVQGNAQGMNPYGYVGGNPETKTDPTGHRILDATENGSYANIDPSGNVSIFIKQSWIYASPNQPYHGIYQVHTYTKAEIHTPVSAPPHHVKDNPSVSNSGDYQETHFWEGSWSPWGIPLWQNEGTASDLNWSYGAGIGPTNDGSSWNLGLSTDEYAFDVNDQGVIGNQMLGITYQGGIRGPEFNAQAGLADGKFGLGVNYNPLGSAYGSVGVNIAHVNASVTASVGPALQLGLSIGSKGLEVSLPGVSIGVSLSFTSFGGW